MLRVDYCFIFAMSEPCENTYKKREPCREKNTGVQKIT